MTKPSRETLLGSRVFEEAYHSLSEPDRLRYRIATRRAWLESGRPPPPDSGDDASYRLRMEDSVRTDEARLRELEAPRSPSAPPDPSTAPHPTR